MARKATRKKSVTRKKNTQRKSAANAARLRLVVLCMALLLLGLVLCLMLYQHGTFKQLFSSMPRHQHKSQMVKKPQVNKVSLPQFDFYNVLTKEKNQQTPTATTNDDQDNVLMAPADPKHPQGQILTPKKHYHLQIAAFSHQLDAEQMRANLLLLGINVIVKKVSVHDHTWFRVVAGPYATTKAAKADQARLQQAKIASILR